MDKRSKQLTLITSGLCLLPLILSVVLYPQLPQQIAVHWNGAGIADRFMPKAVAAFGLPVFFVAVNLYSKLRLLNDPRNNVRSRVIVELSVWLIPVVSVILVPVTLFIALGADIPITLVVSLAVGILLVVVGNYLPKNRQNSTIGIKLPWTLHNADNWNKTHRMAGYLWMVGGVLLIASSLFLRGWGSHFPMTIVLVLVLVLTPAIYSFALYKNANRNHTV